jgi:hypothetical protein
MLSECGGSVLRRHSIYAAKPVIIPPADIAKNAADQAKFDADPNRVYPAAANAAAAAAFNDGPPKPNEVEGLKYFVGLTHFPKPLLFMKMTSGM